RDIVAANVPVTDNDARVYNLERFEHVLNEVMIFMASAGDTDEIGTFTVANVYERGAAQPVTKTFSLRRDDLLILDFGYSHDFAPIRNQVVPTVSILIDKEVAAARAQLMARSRRTYVGQEERMRLRERYYDLSIVPTWIEYVSHNGAADVVVSLKSTSDVWTVKTQETTRKTTGLSDAALYGVAPIFGTILNATAAIDGLTATVAMLALAMAAVLVIAGVAVVLAADARAGNEVT